MKAEEDAVKAPRITAERFYELSRDLRDALADECRTLPSMMRDRAAVSRAAYVAYERSLYAAQGRVGVKVVRR